LQQAAKNIITTS